MAELKDAFKFEQINLNNKLCIKITFYSNLLQEDAVAIRNEWKEIFSLNTDKKLIVILNTINLNDYSPMARIVIKKMIHDFKYQIENIWLVTDSKLLIIRAFIVSLFSPLKIRTVNLESKIFV